MQEKIIWLQGSNNPENGNNLVTIKQWWTSLHDKKITWRQRLIPQTEDVSALDWEPQRFDEVFKIQTPEIRGITLYWHKPDTEQERSTTPRKLELEKESQQLYIYPQSQGTNIGENYILTLRDEQQKLDIQVTLSPANLEQLKENLPE